MNCSGLICDNPHLLRLPNGIFHTESTMGRVLEDLELSNAPLSEKLRIIQQYELEPYISGLELRGDFQLLIRVSDDLTRISYFRIKETPTIQELNNDGYMAFEPKNLELLAEVENPSLIFSPFAISKATGPAEMDALVQLMSWGKRITEYRGVQITWDQSVDKKVWTTNIDTVNIINGLYEDGVFDSTSAKTVLELGVGGGAISKTLVRNLPCLETLVATDILSYALVCTERNIRPVLKPEQKLELYQGKGIRNLSIKSDLVILNPPYLPTEQPPEVSDPYRGTGLIKEVVGSAQDILTPDNPDAAIYMGMSHLAERDLDKYLSTNPNVQLEIIGTPKQVPLKIFKVHTNESWIDFLVNDCGLIASKSKLQTEGYEFWHRIYLAKLTIKDF